MGEYDHLDALERRGDELEAFAHASRQAQEYIRERGTQKLVDELKAAIEDRRRVRVGTINCIVMLEHIKRLEAELAKEPLSLG